MKLRQYKDTQLKEPSDIITYLNNRFDRDRDARIFKSIEEFSVTFPYRREVQIAFFPRLLNLKELYVENFKYTSILFF